MVLMAPTRVEAVLVIIAEELRINSTQFAWEITSPARNKVCPVLGYVSTYLKSES